MEFPLDKQSYELLHLISHKPGAKIYVARCIINGKLVCVKIVDFCVFQVNLESLRQTVSFWATSKNDNLIKYYGAFTADTSLWILSEYMDGGSMHDIMQFAYARGFKDEVLVASILEPVVRFLVYFHENRQIHRDIRPGTLLASNSGEIKVGSLGCATALIQNGRRKGETKAFIGAQAYSAPEVLKEGKGYTECADIWSLGITAIELSTGKTPYSDLDPLKIQEIITTSHAPQLKAGSGVSAKFSEFVRMCLRSNPLKRMKAKDLLKSSFIKLSKGKKYIASTLMSNMPPQYQIYGMTHPGIEIEPEKVAFIPKFVFDGFDDGDGNGTNKNKANQSRQAIDEKADTVRHVGRFTVTYRQPPGSKLKRESVSYPNQLNCSDLIEVPSLKSTDVLTPPATSSEKADFNDEIIISRMEDALQSLGQRIEHIEESNSIMTNQISSAKKTIAELCGKKVVKID